MDREKLIKTLSANDSFIRLKGIKQLKKMEGSGSLPKPMTSDEDFALSFQTNYSFSPYTPSLAAFRAYQGGIGIAGIADHDGLAGAEEFARACSILGVESTCGVQLFGRFYSGANRWLNNFYERDIGCVTLRGVPSCEIESLHKELEPTRVKRAERDKKMVEKLNLRLKKHGLDINFDKDVKARSYYKNGGTITERHILFALAGKLVEKFGDAGKILDFLKNDFNVKVDEAYLPALSDINNPYYTYDLVDCLKHEINFFYIPMDDVMGAPALVDLAHRHGALITYDYVGEVRRNYGGQQEVITLENEFTEQLFKDLGTMGFDAVEYDPVAIPEEDAKNLRELAGENGMFTLPHSDFNSPRQKFSAKVELPPELVKNVWAVIGHEKSASYSVDDGMNTTKSKSKNPSLSSRLDLYAEIGRLKLR